MAFRSINPATGQLLKEFASLTEEQIEARLHQASLAFQHWRRRSFAARTEILIRTAGILEQDKEDLGRLLTTEMGKTLKSAIAEVEKCAAVCHFYAENAEKFLQPEQIATNATESYIQYKPLGPILAVMPWNFPFWQVFRFAAPALMAGNVCLLKHAANVPQCALKIEEIFLRAGAPDGAFQTLLVESSQIEKILRDPHVVAATLTGSEGAGKAVASIAGSEIKKTVLELGGSDPFIVMESADLEKAVLTAVKARTINNGQSCIAAKRFIVADAVYDDFKNQFVNAMNSLKLGDPLLSDTEIGPLATPSIREELHNQVGRAIQAGGRLLIGGKMIDGPGNFYQPTVISDVPRTSDIFYEEFFGPVALLFRVHTADEALELANNSSFGLGASIWTSDEQEQQKMIDGLESGSVFINAMVASDPRLPFGGVKKSGYGRELSAVGIREFVNIQTVWIN